jgi:hypothetical protein
LAIRLLGQAFVWPNLKIVENIALAARKSSLRNFLTILACCPYVGSAYKSFDLLTLKVLPGVCFGLVLIELSPGEVTNFRSLGVQAVASA